MDDANVFFPFRGLIENKVETGAFNKDRGREEILVSSPRLHSFWDVYPQVKMSSLPKVTTSFLYLL